MIIHNFGCIVKAKLKEFQWIGNDIRKGEKEGDAVSESGRGRKKE